MPVSTLSLQNERGETRRHYPQPMGMWKNSFFRHLDNSVRQTWTIHKFKSKQIKTSYNISLFVPSHEGAEADHRSEVTFRDPPGGFCRSFFSDSSSSGICKIGEITVDRKDCWNKSVPLFSHQLVPILLVRRRLSPAKICWKAKLDKAPWAPETGGPPLVVWSGVYRKSPKSHGSQMKLKLNYMYTMGDCRCVTKLDGPRIHFRLYFGYVGNHRVVSVFGRGAAEGAVGQVNVLSTGLELLMHTSETPKANPLGFYSRPGNERSELAKSKIIHFWELLG